MFRQNQVLRTLSQPDALARLVCQAFDFFDARGRLQVSTCAQALRTLADRKLVSLPSPATLGVPFGPRLLDVPVPAPSPVPESVADIEYLTTEVVTTKAQRAIWNTLLHYEHPRGTTMFAGAQIRYLVHSEQGYLAAAGISACTLHLADRDRWMAWSREQKAAFQHHVVCLSRFLVRGACPHLASHVLGRLLRRLPQDFDATYGYRPWVVETYVDPAWAGTCFKAANFRFIGHTSGRRRHTQKVPNQRKALYVFELTPRWRAQLGGKDVDVHPVRAVHEGLSQSEWAMTEFGDAPLGDKRLSTRLVKSAELLYSVLGQSICANTSHDQAAVTGHYRLLEQGPDSKVTPENILKPHRMRTIERMRSQKVVLCIQDGSTLNYTTRSHCEGLEVIGRNQLKEKGEAKGLPLHVTLCTTAEGVPLGVLRCSQTYRTDGPLKPHSQQWVDGYDDICDATASLSKKTQVVCVMDREADFFALFDAQRPRVDLVVRARHNRRLDGCALFAKVRQASVAGTVAIDIGRISARRKTSRRQARDGRRRRMAICEVRFVRVQLPCPQRERAPVDVYVVQIKEPHAPAGVQPVEWILLTTLPIHTAADALRVVEYYVRRWRIEEFFRVLKSGCKVEQMQLRSALRLKRACALYCVIAWRIMLLVLLGRTTPELDAEVFYSEPELYFLRHYATSIGLPGPTTLQAATLLVAVFGGYQNRKHDGPPGFQIMWRGGDRLNAAAEAVAVLPRPP